MAGFVRAWASGAGVVILLSALAAVILITRVSLSTQTSNVELLRCLGAPDDYLACQFERHALLSALRGGAVGFGLAVPTLIALLSSSSGVELAGTIRLGLQPGDWALLACMPAVCVLLVVAAARTTAAQGLARMP
jgi:cell division transport system permease protein